MEQGPVHVSYSTLWVNLVVIFSPRVCENLNVHMLSVCCISKFEPYMLCCRSSVITHFNKHMSCILTQVVAVSHLGAMDSSKGKMNGWPKDILSSILQRRTSPLGQENQQMQILSLAGFFLWNLQATKFRRKSPSIELQIWKQRTLDDILGLLKKAIREWDCWTAKLSDFGIEHNRKQVAISQSVILRCRNCARGNHKISKWILCWEKAEEWWREKMVIHGPIAIIDLP